MNDCIDHKRRDFLKKTAVTLGGLGVAAASIPFIKACQPGTLALLAAEPVQVDISSLQPGQQLTVEWRGMPIWIIHRTPEEIASLKRGNAQLRDPDSQVDQQPPYAKNPYRSIKPEILVLVGLCTHLGCIPHFFPKPGEISQEWPGGFLCPCHGSKFDMAGRVFKNVPAPINLQVPQYAFLNEHTLLIGAEHAR